MILILIQYRYFNAIRRPVMLANVATHLISRAYDPFCGEAETREQYVNNVLLGYVCLCGYMSVMVIISRAGSYRIE